MNFSDAMFFEAQLFDIGFPYKHCYFRRVCLLVKMASKTMIRPIQYNGSKSSFLNISVIPRLIAILLHIKVVYFGLKLGVQLHTKLISIN